VLFLFVLFLLPKDISVSMAGRQLNGSVFGLVLLSLLFCGGVLSFLNLAGVIRGSKMIAVILMILSGVTTAQVLSGYILK